NISLTRIQRSSLDPLKLPLQVVLDLGRDAPVRSALHFLLGSAGVPGAAKPRLSPFSQTGHEFVLTAGRLGRSCHHACYRPDSVPIGCIWELVAVGSGTFLSLVRGYSPTGSSYSTGRNWSSLLSW